MKIINSLEKGINACDETVEVINLGTDEEKKEVKIVDNPKREEMIALFKEYMNVFTWSYKDMPGLDPNIVAHKIPLLEGMEPKQQRLRRMSPEMSLKIRDEVTKQLNTGFSEVPLDT